MALLADPTVEFMDRFADESQWIIKRRVPVFKPHRYSRTKPRYEGDRFPVEYTVTESDISKVVQKMNASQEKGVPARLTVGHVNKAKTEDLQPKVVGYWLNAKVGKFGPEGETCILADAYVKKSCRDEVKGRPYRSAEYYHDARELRGVGVFTSDPALELGTVELYSLPEGAVFVPIEGEIYMATENTCPEGHDQWAKHMDHYCNSQPWMKHAMETYQASAASGTNVTIPAAGAAPKKKDDVEDAVEAERMQRDDELATYAKLEGKIAELQNDRENDRKLISKLTVARDRADCERMVKQLQLEGYSLKTAATVEKLVKKTPEAREEWIADLREHATPEPVRDMIETYQENVEGPPAAKPTSLTPEQAAQAASYAAGNPSRFEKARSCLLSGQPLPD